MAEKVVLFDVENTLLRESKDVSQYYFEAIRNAYGLSLEDIDISPYEGFTIQETVRDILSKNGLTKDEIDEKMELFVNELPYAHYNVAGHDKVVVIDGAIDLLKHLHKRGHVMGVASGQLERVLRNMFERGGIEYDSYFKFGTYGDAGEHISKIIEASVDVAEKEFKTDRKHIVFVSSSKRNITAAHAFGINTVGVITDAESKRELEGSGITAVVRNLRDCARFID